MISISSSIWLFVFYSVVIIGIVYVTRKPSSNTDDFLVMGRELGVFKGSLSIAVSWIWAPAVFICAAQAYTQGLPGIFWFTLPNIITFFIFVPFALKIRQSLPKGVTSSGIFRHRFTKNTLPHKASLIITFGYQLGAIIINCVAGATLINLLSGIPYEYGVIMMGGLALAYSLISGLRASVVSDVIQMSMILLVAFVIVPWALNEAGGMSIIEVGLGGHTGEFRDLMNPEIAFSFGIATSIGLIAGPVADQMFYQRAFAAKENSIKKIFVYGGLIFGLVPILLSLLGFIGAGLAISGSDLNVTDAQMVGPQVIGFLLPEWLLMLFTIMAFAGLTSTLDSAFSAIGSIWAVDVKNYSNDHSHDGISNARKGMLLFAILGMGVALLQPEILWVFLIYGALAASIFFPILLTLFWKKTSGNAVFVGILIGLLAGTPLSIYANVQGDTELIVLSSVLAITLPALITALLTFIMPEKSENIENDEALGKAEA